MVVHNGESDVYHTAELRGRKVTTDREVHGGKQCRDVRQQILTRLTQRRADRALGGLESRP